MLVFALASILLVVKGHYGIAAVPLAGAVLSKETAAVLPLIAAGYAFLVERNSIKQAMWRTRFQWILVFGWLLLHPTLLGRLGAPQTDTELRAYRIPLPLILTRTLLTPLNLDRIPRPVNLSWTDLLEISLSAAVLGVAAYLTLRSLGALVKTDASPLESQGRQMGRWGLWWAAAGWLPLFLPAIGWHAYYGSLGVFGAWLAIASALVKRPRLAVIAVTALGLLRGAQAKSMSWDWGDEWYQRRAGLLLAQIREELTRQYPTLPPQTRVYFGRLPNNVGLIAGKSPALRIWYGDATLRAGFYSDYRPRRIIEWPGKDLFFRFDSLRVLVEVKTGPEDIVEAQRGNPSWEDDHEKLAMLFVRSGDIEPAATEFEKISAISSRADAAVLASVLRQALGDSMRADSLGAAARARLRMTPEELGQWQSNLRTSMPTRSGTTTNAR